MSLRDLFRRDRSEAVAHDLYGAVVRQSRLPAFYQADCVPDTLDGRFDLIALHAFLLMRRLKSESEPGRRLAQALFDVVFADMDQNLREMGVGDLAVGKRVKAMASAFYGRVAAYDAGLAGDNAALADALRRNLYGTVNAEPAAVLRMVEYLRGEACSLDAVPLSQLLVGRFQFGLATSDR
jgi:cytochrome b pre-mRNA-processing protein 3